MLRHAKLGLLESGAKYGLVELFLCAIIWKDRETRIHGIPSCFIIGEKRSYKNVDCTTDPLQHLVAELALVHKGAT